MLLLANKDLNPESPSPPLPDPHLDGSTTPLPNQHLDTQIRLHRPIRQRQPLGLIRTHRQLDVIAQNQMGNEDLDGVSRKNPARTHLGSIAPGQEIGAVAGVLVQRVVAFLLALAVEAERVKGLRVLV